MQEQSEEIKKCPLATSCLKELTVPTVLFVLMDAKHMTNLFVQLLSEYSSDRSRLVLIEWNNFETRRVAKRRFQKNRTCPTGRRWALTVLLVYFKSPAVYRYLVSGTCNSGLFLIGFEQRKVVGRI